MSSNIKPLVTRSGFTRRQFIYTAAVAGAAALTGCVTVAPRKRAATDKLNIGVVGCGGKGAGDTDHCSGENIAALCDVDSDTLNARHAKYPKANTYSDWRVMLEKEKTLDAVIVATPDHMHAMVAAT